MTSASGAAIEAVDLGKTFDRRVKKPTGRGRRVEHHDAVSAITMRIDPGEIVGYIGPNGAGKSTTIKMLTGILRPSSGSVYVAGLVPIGDRVKLARRIGVVFGQRSNLWWDLPLRDSFDLLRHIYRVPAPDHARTLNWLTELLQLGPFLGMPVRALSLGQRMRGELTSALLHNPEIVFLDEPTVGLDVVSKHAVREALRTIHAERGVTIVLTTHDLADVEELCGRLVIIDHGRLIHDGPTYAFKGQFGGERTLVVDLVDARQPLEVDGARCTRVDGPRQWLQFPPSTSAASVLAAVAAQAEVRDLTVEEPAIEDIVRRIYERHRA